MSTDEMREDGEERLDRPEIPGSESPGPRLKRMAKSTLEWVMANQSVSLTILSMSLSITVTSAVVFTVNNYTQVFSNSSGWEVSESVTATDLDATVGRDLTVARDISLLGQGSVLKMAGAPCDGEDRGNASTGVLCFDEDDQAFKVSEGDGKLRPIAFSETEAVAAMGATEDANPLNHDRPSEGEVFDAVLEVDGPDSGLDADLLDGRSSDDFVSREAFGALRSGLPTIIDVAASRLIEDAVGSLDDRNPVRHDRYTDDEAMDAVVGAAGRGSGLDADLLDGSDSSAFATASVLQAHVRDAVAHGGGYTDLQAVAAVLAADGRGSGLDADRLDGLEASAFVSTVDFTAHADESTEGLIALQSHVGDTAAHGSGYTDAQAVAAMGDAFDTNPLHHDRYSDDEAVTAMDGLSDINPLNHARYTTGEAVQAMGAKSALNPLNHDRYTNGDAVAAVLAADGPGSLVNADLLDGREGDDYVLSSEHGLAFLQTAPVDVTSKGFVADQSGTVKSLVFGLPEDGWILVQVTGYMEPGAGNDTRLTLRAVGDSTPLIESTETLYRSGDHGGGLAHPFTLTWVFPVVAGGQSVGLFVSEFKNFVDVTVLGFQVTFFESRFGT